MADAGGIVRSFFDTILQNPVYLLTTVGAIALVILLFVAFRIHKIHSEAIFLHQAWGAKWKGR